MARKSRVLTDHDEVRRWAEARGAQPACVRGAGSEEDVGMIRLELAGYSGETSLEPVEWDEWLQKFDENNLALLVEDEMAGGEQSNFNKIIGRETAARGQKTSRPASSTGEEAGNGSRKRSARARARRGGSRSAVGRSSGSRSSRSRSRRSTSPRGKSRRSRSSRSQSSRTTTGKKRAKRVGGNARSRPRRRAA